jgi:hypothetical protein
MPDVLKFGIETKKYNNISNIKNLMGWHCLCFVGDCPSMRKEPWWFFSIGNMDVLHDPVDWPSRAGGQQTVNK